MSHLEFSVLGPLEVRRDGTALEVPRGRRSAVLAALLQHQGRRVSSGALVEAAWAPAMPADPAAALRTVISRLRAVLGANTLRTAADGYALVVPDDAVDARRFEELVGRARDTSAAEAAPLLDRALALWRGAAYEGLTDLPYVAPEATRLEEVRAGALEERGAVALHLGHLEEGIEILEQLCRDYPYRERAQALLMSGLQRAGRTTLALERYRAYRDLLVEELGLEPSPTLRDLHRRILGRQPTSSGIAKVAPLPVWLDLSTSFIGRAGPMDALARAVRDSRVVTITGAGGIGKTRLVAEALPRIRDDLAAPVVVIELAAVHTGGVDAAMAAALGLGQAQDPREAVLEFCSAWAGVIVLDNCEHVRDELAGLVELLLRRSSTVRVIATSRRRLGVSSEQQHPLELLTPADAAQLFEDRLHRLRPDASTAGCDAAIARICELVDRLPLAVELTAARAAVVGIDQVPQRLSDVSFLLDLSAPTSKSDVLRAVVGWSYELLSPDERHLLMLLSTAAEDLDLLAVESLARAWGAPDLPRSLPALLDASLLTLQEVAGTTTYRMLAMVRAFAAERLRGSGELDRARGAHACWVRDEIEAARVASLGPTGGDAFFRLNRIRRSIRAALEWALATSHLGVAVAICGAMEMCPHWTPGAELGAITASVADLADGPDSQRSVAIGAGAVALACAGDLDRSRHYAVRALELAVEPLERCLAHYAGGLSNLYAGDLSAADAHWRRMAELAVPLAYRAEAELSLALTHCFRGQFEAAERHSGVALVLADASGAGAVQAFARYAAGEVAAPTDPELAESRFAEAAALAEEYGALHVSMVARVGRLAVRVRTRARSYPGLRQLLDDGHGAGAWPQILTTLRIVSELLVLRDRFHDARFLLAAIRLDPSAPPVTGDDVARYGRLDERLLDELGAEVVSRLGVMASSVSRAQVLERARVLASELEAPLPGDAMRCAE